MHAIGLSEYGGPEVLRTVELPDPHAGPCEVRIRVRAAGVNPVDAMLRQGLLAAAYAGALPPFVPGLEVCGTVDEVGDGADVMPGTDVVAMVDGHGSHGGYSDLVVVPAGSVAPLPAWLSFAEGASFLNNALTARNALDALALPPGATLLVTGAAGAVGGYLTQLAVAEGLRVVAVASLVDEELVRGFGAHEFLARGDDLVERVRALVPYGADAVADAALLHEQVVPAIRDGGAIATFRGWAQDPGRGIVAHPLNVRQRARDAAAIRRIGEQVGRGELAVRVAKVLPAAQAVEAHRLLDRGRLRGRIVLELPVAG